MWHTFFCEHFGFTALRASFTTYDDRYLRTSAQASVGRDGHDKVVLWPLGRVDTVIRRHRRVIQLRRPRLYCNVTDPE